jgi:hypothetical protein
MGAGDAPALEEGFAEVPAVGGDAAVAQRLQREAGGLAQPAGRAQEPGDAVNVENIEMGEGLVDEDEADDEDDDDDDEA